MVVSRFLMYYNELCRGEISADILRPQHPTEQSCPILAILSVPQGGHMKRKRIIIAIAPCPSRDFTTVPLITV